MPAAAKPPAPKRKRRRWVRYTAGPLLLLALAAWFAPSVVAHTGLRNKFIRDAATGLKGDVTAAGASLGWFSPVALRDVRVTDPQGRVLLAVPKVTSSKTLLALIRDRSDLGEFRVERPAVEIVAENGTTNLEDAFAEFLKDESPAGTTHAAVTVTVSDGTFTFRAADKTWQFDAVQASVAVPRSRSEPVAAKLSAAGHDGKLEADAMLGDTGSVKLTAAGFPLEAAAPLLRRVESGLSVGGRLTTDLRVEWGESRVRIDGTASVADLDLSGPRLGGDHLKLALAEMPLKLEANGKAVRIEKAELKCDVGTLAASGSFDPDNSLDKVFDKSGVAFAADIDLAKLAAKLPKLLRLRDDTAIREGRLTAKLASRTTPNGTTWDGEVRTTALKAERGGRPVEWPEPLTVEFSGRVPAGHLPTFDKLVCRSDFISINAQGSPESFRAAANVYLGRLSDRLAEFVDLKGARLAGNAAAWVVAGRTPQGQFKVEGSVDLAQFEFRDRTGRVASEPSVKLRAASAGVWIAHGPLRLDTGSASFAAGTDTLEVRLLEPIADAKPLSAAKASVQLGGGLDTWMPRVAGFVAVPKKYVFGGRITAGGTARLAAGQFAIDRLLLSIQNARFQGAGLNIDEPKLDAVADLTVERGTGKAEFAKFDINSAVFSISGGRLGFDPQAAGGLVVDGGGNATTDLNRLGRALKIQSDPAGGDALRGRGNGPIKFRWHGDTTNFDGTLDVRNFAYGDPAKTGIAEPSCKLFVDGRYAQTPDTLTFNMARLQRTGLWVEVKGTMGKFDTTRDVNLTGTVSYILAALTPELQKAIGGHFQATGDGSKPFALAGSLTPGAVARLIGDAGLGWNSVKAYGFDMGPGELKAKLAGGTLSFNPVAASFGGGQITLTPTLRLDPEPSELTFARGKVVDHAKLTPAACASGLGYALPVIANATQAEGEVSVVLDENHIPPADFTRATAKGQVVVHKATVGAGPVVTEVAKLLGGPATSIALANEMTVPVKVENGRVHHENLALTVNGFVVRTSGSVGFDGSLAMVADVPIPAGLLKNSPQLMSALAGKTVKVPIAGTMSKPTLDPHQFQAAVATLARDAVKGVGRDLVNKELDKLFPGMPKK